MSERTKYTKYMKYMSASEAAELWGRSYDVVRRDLRNGRIPSAYFSGGRWWIPLDATPLTDGRTKLSEGEREELAREARERVEADSVLAKKYGVSRQYVHSMRAQ